MTRVLVVDDSSLLGGLLSELLTDEGHQVRAVDHDFHDLLDPTWLGWYSTDVVVCDLFLNEPVTGVDILAVAKHDHPSVYRIAWSGTGSPLLIDAEPLADLVVVKPGVQDVLDAVRARG